MRVCDFTTLYLDGGESGVNTYLHEKARFLSLRRPADEHILVVPGRTNETRRMFRSTLHVVKSPRIPGKPDHRLLTDFARARGILRAEAPDVVETDCVYFLARVARRALPETPLVGFYHVHLPSFIARPRFARFGRTPASLVEALAWRYVRFCSAVLDRIVVSSRDVERRLAAAGFDRLVHVPLGVNVELFRGRPRANGHSNGCEAKPVVILHVGRLSPEKNQADLIEAFKILSSRGDYRLQIVGDGPSRRELERRAAGESGISFLGTQPYADRMPGLYAGANLLAQPSPNETFSLTILEALASGLPVVAVRRGGPIDLVTPERGELARPWDPADLAAKIEAVAKRAEPCGVSSCRGWKSAALEGHSWDRTFERLFDLYDSLVARPQVAAVAPTAAAPEGDFDSGARSARADDPVREVPDEAEVLDLVGTAGSGGA